MQEKNLKKILKKFTTNSIKLCPFCKSIHNKLWEKTYKETITALECIDCGLVYMNKRLSNDSLAKFYNKYNSLRDNTDLKLKQKRIQMYNIDHAYLENIIYPKGKILDIGCGNGDFLAKFDEKINKFGIEVDVDAIEKGGQKHPNIIFFTSINEVPSKIKFDSIIFRGSFQYIREIKKTVNFCHKKLKKGGLVCILSLPNTDSPVAIMQREKWVMCNKIEHLHLFNMKIIKKIFDKNFQLKQYDFPYIGTPYEDHKKNLDSFIKICKSSNPEKLETFPFWGSVINVIFQKV